MKHLLDALKKEPAFRRSIIYKVFGRCVAGLTAALLWDRFLNRGDRAAMYETAFFVIGALMAALAWFTYLRMDGVGGGQSPRTPLRLSKRPPRGDLVDYADEPVPDLDPREPEERQLCSLVAWLLSAALFLLPSLLLML